LEPKSFSHQILFHSRFDDLRSWCERLRVVLVSSITFHPVKLKHSILPTNQVNMLIAFQGYTLKHLLLLSLTFREGCPVLSTFVCLRKFLKQDKLNRLLTLDLPDASWCSFPFGFTFDVSLSQYHLFIFCWQHWQNIRR
jgi:hypothetical protein